MKSPKQRWTARRVRRQVERFKSNCHRCGLLGVYFDPEGATGDIDSLGELPARDRATLGSELAAARSDGKPVAHGVPQQDLGMVDWWKGGVLCGIRATRGPTTNWFVRGPRQEYREYLEMAVRTAESSGALVTVRDPEYPGILGRVVGVAQTQRLPLIMSHDCEHFVSHQAGQTPEDHVGLREELKANRRDEVRKWITVAVTVAVGVTGIVWRLATL